MTANITCTVLCAFFTNRDTLYIFITLIPYTGVMTLRDIFTHLHIYLQSGGIARAITCMWFTNYRISWGARIDDATARHSNTRRYRRRICI